MTAKKIRLLLLMGGITLLSFRLSFSQPDSILFFVSYDSTYYSEYLVMYQALIAAGYFVDVRSAGSGSAGSYLIGGDIQAQANSLAGSSYSAFQAQFQTMFGSIWNEGFNVPSDIPLQGTIQNISSLAPYKALVIAGGTGVIDYRIDGTYPVQGSLSASQVQEAAEKLNALAVEALLSGKPVMGQCHGASLPAFWRVPATAPNGFDQLGHSLLAESIATGYPEAATMVNLSDLNVTFRADDKVVVGTPHPSLPDENRGAFRIITTRDWYPQTVAHAAKTLINIITSYPDASQLNVPVSVLIIHGGAVDLSNCSAGNPNNDVPCNYGIHPASNIPADYSDLVTLFNSNQFSDGFTFTVSDLNLFATLPFNLADETDILTYLNNFEVVFFYKHWSSMVTTALQNAIVKFADDGGGVVSIHHGLYNENKNILVDSLFQAHAPAAGWSANRTNYQIFQTNYGHFVSTFGLINDGVSGAPAAWTGNPLLTGSNLSLSLYPRFSIFDEIYNNMQFVGGATFGDGVNQINPIFSNDQTPSGQCHVHGFVKLFDGNEDMQVGRVVYSEAGETKANYQYSHPYAQFIRNAVYWARGEKGCQSNSAVWVTGTGQWETVTNWSGNNLPDRCSTVVIPDQELPATVTVTGDSEITVQLLEIGINVIFSIPLGTLFSVTGQ